MSVKVELPDGVVEELRALAPKLEKRLPELSVCMDDCSTTVAEQLQRLLALLASATVNGELLIELEESGKVTRIGSAIPLGPGSEPEEGSGSSSGVIARGVWDRLKKNKPQILDAVVSLDKAGEFDLSSTLCEIHRDLGTVLTSLKSREPA